MEIWKKVFRREEKDVLEELGKVRERLRVAYAKLLIARRFATDREVRRTMLMTAAFTGNVFLTPDALGQVYVKSCVAELKKASKKLRKIARREELDEVVKLQLESLASMLVEPEENIPKLSRLIADAERTLDAIVASLSGVF